MASIVVSGDTSGAITIAAPAVAGTNTLTLPASTGTLVVTGGAQTIEFAAGTVSAPSITTTGDTNTGMFFPAADTIAFTEGGVESMRIDSAGDVGIGSTNPTRKLQISQSIATTYTGDFDDAPNQLFIVYTNTTTNAYTGLQMDVGGNSQAAISAVRVGDGEVAMTFGTRVAGSRAERMRIDSSGRLLINTTTARTTLTGDRSALVQIEGQSVDQFLSIIRNENNAFGAAVWLGKSRGTTAGSNTTVQAGDSLGSLVFLGANGTNTQQAATISVEATGTISASAMPGNMIFTTTGAGSNTPTERMRIDSNGNLLVGTTGGQSSRIVTQADGTSIYGLTSNMTAASGTRYHCIFRESNTERGSITSNGSATAYNTSSDYRLKENIAPMTGALDKVQQLKPVTYTWKSNGYASQGFIAHELQEIVPDCVVGEKDAVDKDGNIMPQMVDTSFLVATLTAAIQEQQQIINDLKARIETLENT